MELEVDSEDSGLEIGIHERGKVGTGKSSIEKMQLRKYETIKKMTLYLHDEDEREWADIAHMDVTALSRDPTTSWLDTVNHWMKLIVLASDTKNALHVH